MRHQAADAFDEIRANRDKIRANEIPMCPVHLSRPLAECLRSSARCGGECPLRADWIGPNENE
jgi:hypothetical protein